MTRSFTHILVPMDFDAASEAALACATEIARAFDARLSLLHVVTDPNATGMWTPEAYVPASPQARERLLREATQRLERAVSGGDREQFRIQVEARVGAPADVIDEFAREHGVDLIVMGTHGRRGLAHLFLGSVAERVLRSAPCPVLTTRGETEGTAAKAAVQDANRAMA